LGLFTSTSTTLLYFSPQSTGIKCLL
jgi:hypothetical protein